MKNLFRLLMLLSISTFILSCGGDDNDNNNPGMSDNKITTPSGEYEIIGATLTDYGSGSWHDGFNLDFNFLTGTIELDNDGEATGGAGIVAYFEMISTTNGELIEGTYTYEGGGGPYATYTYTDSSEIIDVTDVVNEEFTLLNDPQGNVTIERSGNSYTFNYSSAGYSIQYTGVPTYYDYTSRSMASKKRVLKR